ncbi:MAG: hypothetical protein B9S34_04125 [Opitutia bacterium Tous-C1TDCM]|nr:MAG: hypothetical protein B9S34_04125 [Opitutae bacterium Tous-C1TDCM]
MTTVLIEAAIICCLLLANGIFAMAEISLVSARKGRLKKLAADGLPGAASALALAQDPTRFLSTVQIGITLVGIFAGAYGGATLSDSAARLVATVPLLEPYSRAIGLVLVVGAITYASLVIGELVPKRIGLSNPERKAMLVAAPMAALSRLAAPAVWLLTASSDLVMKLLRLGKEPEAPPSEEEVSQLLEQGAAAGVFHHSERGMVEGVLRLDARPVTDIMTRRNRLVFLNAADPDEINWRKMVKNGHSHFPVYEGTRDHILGMVAVKALWANAAIGVPGHLRDHVTKPLFIPRSANLVQVLETFKATGKHTALVTDEYGSIQGMVTLIDVMEAIVGDLPAADAGSAPDAVQRDDGSWLVDGAMETAELRRRFGFGPLPGEGAGGFETLGGFVLARLGHIPKPGESFVWNEWRFEVVDLDRNRIDKVLLQRRPPAP